MIACNDDVFCDILHILETWEVIIKLSNFTFKIERKRMLLNPPINILGGIKTSFIRGHLVKRLCNASTISTAIYIYLFNTQCIEMIFNSPINNFNKASVA